MQTVKRTVRPIIRLFRVNMDSSQLRNDVPARLGVRTSERVTSTNRALETHPDEMDWPRSFGNREDIRATKQSTQRSCVGWNYLAPGRQQQGTVCGAR